MITPLDAKNRIDSEAVGRILLSFISAGAEPFLLGTTGESFSLSETQKITLVKEAVSSVNGKATVYVGISSNCLSESVDQAKRYADMGADVMVAHQPFYFPMDDHQLMVYFETLADSISQPLILYNNPITTKQSISLDVIEKLSYHPNIYGFKDSERGMERLDKAIGLWKERSDFSHLLGWAAQSAYALMKGSDGIIPSTANLTPEIYVNMYRAAMTGNEKEVNALQDLAARISEIYQKERNVSQSIPALKAMMSVKGICEPYVMSPMLNCSDEELHLISDAMQKMGLV